jgi:hypothetical protein
MVDVDVVLGLVVAGNVEAGVPLVQEIASSGQRMLINH